MHFDNIVRAVSRAIGRKDAPLTAKTVDIIAREFNKHFGAVMQGSKFWVLDKDPAEDESAPLYALQETAALIKMFAPYCLVASNGKPGWNWAEAWLYSPQRDTYNGLTINPSRPPGRGGDGVWNAWPGMRFADITAASPTPAGSCDLIRGHLLEIWCGGNQALFEYIWKLWARMIQKPAERQDVMPILQSQTQGAGKDLPLVLIGRLYPPQGVARLQDIEQLVGQFNKGVLTKPFQHLEDVLYAPSKKQAAKMRGLITGETLTIEEKYEPSVTFPNYLHPWASTNAQHAGDVPRSDRRHPMLELSAARAGDRAYFTNMHDELLSRDERGLKRLRHELLNVKLNGFYPQDIVSTAAREANMIASEDPEIGWWRYVLERGRVGYGPELNTSTSTDIDLPTLRESFAHYSKEHVSEWQRRSYDDAKFAAVVLKGVLKKVLPQPPGYPARVHATTRPHLFGTVFGQSPSAHRVRVYRVLPLDGKGGARELFEAEYGES